MWILAFALAIMTPSVAFGAKDAPLSKKLPTAKQPVVLGTIDSEIEGERAFITIRLDRETILSESLHLEDHGSFFQLRIPQAIVPEPGKFIETKSKSLPKLAVFQISAQDAAIRFFAAEKVSAVKDFVAVEHLGNRIILTIDEGKLVSKAAAAAAKIVASTVVERDNPPPSSLVEADNKGPSSESIVGKDAFNISGPMQTTMIYIGALCALLGLMIAAKPFIRRQVRAANASEPLTMRTLGSMPIAARQKVSLVEIGGKKILLGITAGNISFLTTFDEQGNESLAPERQVSKTKAVNPYAHLFRKHTVSAPKESVASIEHEASASSVQLLPPKPTIKNTTPRQENQAPPPKAKPTQSTKFSGSQINVAVGDSIQESDGESSTISDVTRLIREKIKSLPRI